MRRLLRLYLIAAGFGLISPVATAQEYFGEFLDGLKGAFVKAEPSACPGKNVRKLEVIQEVQDLMVTRHTGEHVIQPGV
ncbi:MAG: hypothetical protein ACREWG_00025 [Gammaproteobacteria bacterium]